MKNADDLTDDLVVDLADCFEFLSTVTIQESLQQKLFRSFGDALYMFLDVPESSIYWKNLKGQILGCNKKMLDIFGVSSREELIGRTDAVLLSNQEDVKRVQNIDQEVMKSGKTLRVEETVTDKEGNIITYLSIKQPLRNQKQEIIGLIGVSIDVTERKKEQKQAEEAKQIEEKLKREFTEQQAQRERKMRTHVTTWTGGLSHNLKNSLHSNGFATEILRHKMNALQGSVSDELLDTLFSYIHIIEQNTKKMAAIIDNSTRRIQELASDDPQPVLEPLPADKLF